jgi:D-aminopeptidase
VLVQTNQGGILQIKGMIIDEVFNRPEDEQGSCMMVVATDAPLDSRNLKRLAKRALLGIARTGGYYSNGSGDYAIAFSTAPDLRIKNHSREATRKIEILRNDKISPLFLAAAEAAEEAILNSLFKAETMNGREGHLIRSLPLDLIKNKLQEREVK